MKTIDNNLEIQTLAEEINQLEQELQALLQSEFAENTEEPYFKELTTEINANNAEIKELIDKNHQLEQTRLGLEGSADALEQDYKQLQQRAKDK